MEDNTTLKGVNEDAFVWMSFNCSEIRFCILKDAAAGVSPIPMHSSSVNELARIEERRLLPIRRLFNLSVRTKLSTSFVLLSIGSSFPKDIIAQETSASVIAATSLTPSPTRNNITVR
jgi:hypothetical protein